jgi:ATP-dependent DNA helicase RecG
MKLTDDLRYVKGVGPKISSILKENGFNIVKDLIFYFPFRYDDFSKIVKIKDLKFDQAVTIYGKLSSLRQYRIGKRKLLITEGILTDDTASLRVLWFGQRHPIKFKGKEIYIAGKLVKNKFGTYFSPLEVATEEQKTIHLARVVPVYRKIGSINSKQIRKIIFNIFQNLDLKTLKDPLPDFILKEFNLKKIDDAILNVHFPKDIFIAKESKKRFIFEDLLIFQLKILKERKLLLEKKAPQIKIYEKETEEILPFKLTEEQKRVWEEIKRDLQNQKPSNRLLQGDVGSGKTVLVKMAIFNVVLNNFQAVLMAPTEVLARQHFDDFLIFFSKKNISLGYISSNECLFGHGGYFVKISKEKMKNNIFQGKVDIVIGTHSLLGEKIVFQKVGIVIIDEQQRFGVEQRAKLIEKSKSNLIPHFISMTATPIPRTLALVLYGDLDISTIKERPFPFLVKTYIVSENKRKKVYEFLKNKIKNGSQLIIVCPRVEEKNDEIKNVKAEYKKIKEYFSDFQIAMLYAKMKSEEKNRIIEDLNKNKINILVTSSVIEVGLNLQNLDLMIIENAERFGLAQLYQMIGRLSRYGKESYAFLFLNKFTKNGYLRLKALKEKKNALELAEIDLKLRGPGEFFGKEQSGIPDLVIEGLKDLNLIEQSKKAAEMILEKDPNLTSFPELYSLYSQKGKILEG